MGPASVVLLFGFPNRRREHQFSKGFHVAQASGDALLSMVAIVTNAVMIRRNLKYRLPVYMAFSLIAGFLNALPLLNLLVNRRDYIIHRGLWVSMLTIMAWHYSLEAADGICKVDYNAGTVGEAVLPYVLLIRSEFLIMIWVSLCMRTLFRHHIIITFIVLLKVVSGNPRRCRWWVLGRPHGPWFANFSDCMRHLMGMVPLAGSWAASEMGQCSVALGFAQVLAGYLFPCYIALLMELQQRHCFLKRHNQRRRLVQDTGDWRPAWLHWRHLSWQVPLSIFGSWYLAEALSHFFAPLSSSI